MEASIGLAVERPTTTTETTKNTTCQKYA